MERLRPPDIEPAVVSILTEDGGPWVSTKFPADEGSAGVIRVSAAGGASPVDLVVVHPTVLVECWHEDETVAHDIAADAWSKLQAAAGSIIEGIPFNRVGVTLPVNNPDTSRRHLTRWQFIAEVWTRLVAEE